MATTFLPATRYAKKLESVGERIALRCYLDGVGRGAAKLACDSAHVTRHAAKEVGGGQLAAFADQHVEQFLRALPNGLEFEVIPRAPSPQSLGKMKELRGDRTSILAASDATPASGDQSCARLLGWQVDAGNDRSRGRSASQSRRNSTVRVRRSALASCRHMVRASAAAATPQILSLPITVLARLEIDRASERDAFRWLPWPSVQGDSGFYHALHNV